MRGMGGNWMRRRDSKPLPQQMVVILSPKAEVFDEVADKLEDAIKKDNKNIIYDIIRKMKMGKNKNILEKERAQKEDEFRRAITEDEPSEVEEEIKERVDDDPMGSFYKQLLNTYLNNCIGDHWPPAHPLPQLDHDRPVQQHHLLHHPPCPLMEGVSLPRQSHSYSLHHQWAQHAIQWEGDRRLHKSSTKPCVSKTSHTQP